jgi:hypothetical protein
MGDGRHLKLMITSVSVEIEPIVVDEIDSFAREEIGQAASDRKGCRVFFTRNGFLHEQANVAHVCFDLL